jgi:hypothetical protein
MNGDTAGGARVISLRFRRSDHDVTNAVQVSSWRAVWEAVHDIFVRLYPADEPRVLRRAFHDFDTLFSGRMPGYLGCDTVYHDIQHTLDMTLAMARLIQGHELSEPSARRLGPGRAALGIITSLFHDAGYIRYAADEAHRHGAEFTKVHVARSAQFLDRYLPSVGLGPAAAVARQIVHFTGYEVRFDQIATARPKDRCLGHLIGTADLMAQMADRCYLEKCRDRLYPEFVLGGIAVDNTKPGEYTVLYESGEDLLRKTPKFYADVMRDRLDKKFNRAYRYVEVLYEGQNPYNDAITNNVRHLNRVIANGDWSLLRRNPPYFLGVQSAAEEVATLVNRQLAALDGQKKSPGDELLIPV